MAQDDFRKAIASLWERLNLQPPRFIEPNRVQLRVEGTTLDLTDNGRGALVVEGIAAPLAADAMLRARQMRKVLETNLGLLVGNEAGVYVKTMPNRETVVAVRASCRLATVSVERLMKKIEDTIETIEYYGAELKLMVGATPQGRPATAALNEPAIIFRP